MEKRTIEINKNLPENVCVSLYDFSAFPVYLEKLTNFWTGIIMPDLKPNDKATWLFSFLKYFIDDEPYFIIWFFINDESVTNEVIIKEINLFLENKEETDDEGERTARIS